ncbi:MAG TPA: ABC transporter substrate-binding protein [Gaiella sp.]|jgi:peptide/nickel transport system substrate-binding protein|nr:ABC transporter substrate-binding protein [Gaiella sp.]
MESTSWGHRRPVHYRRRAAWLLAGVAALLVSIVCSGAALAKSSKAGAVGGTLTWALQTNPASLFDAYYFSAEGSTFFSLVQDHILAPGTFGQPTTGEGSVVQSWKATSATRYVYTIKKGIKFSDGSTLTAADVAFSMNVHRDPKTGSKMGDFFGNVASIRNRGNQVIVVLKKPNSNWQFTPAASPGLVYSQKDYKAKGANFGTPSGMPIGTGPYKFSEFTPNSRVVLVRNPYYKGKKYPWDRIVFPVIPDEQARLLALQSGQIDGTFAVPNNNIGTWIKIPNLKVGTYVSGGWRGFSIDVEDGPFKDVHVRRALAYSLNKPDINEALASSRGVVLDGLPPLLFIKGLLPAAEVNAALKKVNKYPYSLDDAKAELAKSAYPKGFTTTLNTPNGCPACLLLSQVLAQGASKIGITINLNPMPGPQRFQVILDHKPNLGIQVLGQAPDSPHPMQYLDLLYTSAHAQPGYENSANYKNATVDKLIAQGLQSSNLKVAARNALKVMQITSAQVPYIPVFMFPGAWAVKSGWEFKSSIGPFYYNQIWLKDLVAK